MPVDDVSDGDSLRTRERFLYIETIQLSISDNDQEVYLLCRRLEGVVDREEGIATQERISNVKKLCDLHKERLKLELHRYREMKREQNNAIASLGLEASKREEWMRQFTIYGKKVGFEDE